MLNKKKVAHRSGFEMLEVEALLNVEGGEYEGGSFLGNLKDYIINIFHLNNSDSN